MSTLNSRLRLRQSWMANLPMTVLQPLAQQRVGLLQPQPHGPVGNVQRSGDLLLPKALVTPQHNDLPVLLRQAHHQQLAAILLHQPVDIITGFAHVPLSLPSSD